MFYTHVTWTIRMLFQIYQDGKYVVPEWQREQVWTKKEKLEFIRSLAEEDLPIPELCFWDNEDGSKWVTDGLQRTTNTFGFLQDDFCYGDDVWFSHLPQEKKDKILDTKVNIVLLGPENTEDEVIRYFNVLNTGGKSLVAGEILNSWCKKPINIATNSVFNELSHVIADAFGEKKKSKRSGDLANRVQYLASDIGGLDTLSKSASKLADVLEDTTQAQVDEKLPQFKANLLLHIGVCKRIADENPEQKSKWKGFPPLGKVSSIWVSIMDPSLIDNRNPPDFWSKFYEKLRADKAYMSSWETMTRKNANPKVLKEQIAWAKQVVGTQ